MVTRGFHRYYPMPRMVKIIHDWAGPIDRIHDSLPIFGRLCDDPMIYYGVGWSATASVPASSVADLASLATGQDDEWSQCALATGSGRSFLPQPIRFVGAQIVREATFAKRMPRRSGSALGRPAVAVSKLAPTGLEDK